MSRNRKSKKPVLLLAGPAVLLALLALAAPAGAAEEPDAAVLAKAVQASLKVRDGTAVSDALAAVVASYGKVARAADRKRLLSAVGRALRSKDEAVRRAALQAFEDMGDPHAWKHYGWLLKSPPKKELPRLVRQAMDVSRVLKPEGAVAPLLRILKKAKSLPAAAHAMRTLGAFGKSRQRLKILEAVIAVTRKEKPGVRGRGNPVWVGRGVTGEEARNRWQALAVPMVRAANELTGQACHSTEEWFSLWDESRRDPKSLFA